MNSSRTSSRRLFLRAASASVAIIAAPAVRSQSRSDQVIYIREPGGPYKQAFTTAFYRPFEQATGVKVVGISGDVNPVAQIKSMVDTKNYAWDMALINSSTHNAVVRGGYLEPLRIEGTAFDEIPTTFKRPTFAPIDISTAVIAYRTDTVKRPPKSWADFFNTKDFPGRRSLPNFPYMTLDAACLAAGVSPASLYPLDLAKAYKKLDEIKPSVNIWWTSGTQSSQLLRSGEMDMALMWNSRIQDVIDDGAPIAIEWNQGLIGPEGMVILKGTPKLELCRKFAAFCMSAKQQAMIAPFLTYGPANPKSFDFIDPQRAKKLSTYPEYIKQSLVLSEDYWGEAILTSSERYTNWLLQK